MKNKALALSAAILLSAGIAFSFANTNGQVCAQSQSCMTTTEACCDLPCPIDDCPIPCCDASGACCTK
jgi:hypothetical protein